jgi:hypothetical protein
MVKRQQCYKGLGRIAEKICRNRSYVSQVVHGRRKSKTLALLLWREYGIKAKGQGVKYE